MYGLKDSLLREIIALAQKYNLSSVTLFGSRARGDYRERSDIDLAVSGGDLIALPWMWMKKHPPC